MARTFTIGQVDRFITFVSEESKKAAKRGLLAAAQRAVQHIVTDIIPATVPEPVNRGVYRAGWRAQATKEGAAIVNAVAWAPLIEYGVRARRVRIGRAMLDAIAAWVRMKGIGGRFRVGKKGTQAGRVILKRATKSEAMAIAWAIAKSMQRRGIFAGGRGLKILERASQRFPQFIQEECKREIEKEFSGR